MGGARSFSFPCRCLTGTPGCIGTRLAPCQLRSCFDGFLGNSFRWGKQERSVDTARCARQRRSVRSPRREESTSHWGRPLRRERAGAPCASPEQPGGSSPRGVSTLHRCAPHRYRSVRLSGVEWASCEQETRRQGNDLRDSAVHNRTSAYKAARTVAKMPYSGSCMRPVLAMLVSQGGRHG